MNYKFYQCIYDLDGKRLNPTNIWTPINFWDDACWDRAVPRDCRGLTYLDVGCNEGLYLLRFEQSGGQSYGLDFCSDEGFLIVKRMYDTQYRFQYGGFQKGKVIPEQKEKFNIVSCMNTLEYIHEIDIAISELFKIAKDRVIICTETSMDKPTWYAKYHNARCINLDELKNKIPWPYSYWTLIMEKEKHNEVFLVAESPESSLKPVDTSEIIFNLNITETQKNRGVKCIL